MLRKLNHKVSCFSPLYHLPNPEKCDLFLAFLKVLRTKTNGVIAKFIKSRNWSQENPQESPRIDSVLKINVNLAPSIYHT